jgi:hypothetical protein
MIALPATIAAMSFELTDLRLFISIAGPGSLARALADVLCGTAPERQA